METIMKRESIDLPADVMDRLAEMALQSGKTLKTYMEGVLVRKASESNPSPSTDSWFDDEENMRIVRSGIRSLETDGGKIYTSAELKQRLGQ